MVERLEMGRHEVVEGPVGLVAVDGVGSMLAATDLNHFSMQAGLH
jgi:hypothetical protein